MISASALRLTLPEVKDPGNQNGQKEQSDQGQGQTDLGDEVRRRDDCGQYKNPNNDEAACLQQRLAAQHVHDHETI